MTTILMTGVTGTVMSPLCARLLEEGHAVVALVRPAHGTSPEERLKNSLRVEGKTRERLFALPGDITQPMAGVSLEDCARWRGKIDKILHGAASIKFVETADNQVFNTNVCGTQNMLRLAGALDVPEFHYVSTAYVCGDVEYFSESDLGKTAQHRNAYEHSKAQAEELVQDAGMGYSIYRIPIVVGDSQTGEIGNFSGYYGFLTPFWQLSQSLHKKWGENQEELRKLGITMDGEGYLHIPLAVPCSWEGPLNLVSLDWLAAMLLRLVEMPADGATYHLTHPHPRGVRETMVASLACLGLRGVACGTYPNGDKPGLLGRLQKGILKNVEPYWPYISKDREYFRNEAAVRALGSNWEDPPDIDSAFVRRLLEFAKSKNFGRS